MQTERLYGLRYPSRSIINRKMTIFRVYNKKVIDYIVKYSELVHMAEMHKLRHMNSFRIFYDIQSITYKYWGFKESEKMKTEPYL